MRRGSALDEPALSVVVPSVSGFGDLSDCLDALVMNARTTAIEVLVPNRCGEDLRRRVASRFPDVRVLDASPSTSIPELRAMGFAAARGASVAVIEDHVMVPPDWAEQLLRAQQRGEDVVGGSVQNGATDWAAFYCEYGHLLPPIAAGPVRSLTGNNTVYRGDLLRRYAATARATQWEHDLHDSLVRSGVTLVCRPEIQVSHRKHYTVDEYHARSYAAGRLEHSSRLLQIAYGIAAAALPPVLFFRIVRRIAVKPGHRWRLIRTLPLIGLFVCAWGAGEVAGAWTGSGDSLSRVS
jgi:hypothetical protein